MANHSSDTLDKIDEFADLDRCRIPNMDNNESQIEYERQCSFTVRKADRCRLHKKEDVYGNESIIRKRVEVDVYGRARRAADLKFKCVRDAQEWMEAVGRRMGVRVRAVAVLTLLMTMLATSCAAPAPHHTRTTRNTHHDKSVRNYLQQFGYLNKDSLKVANLVMGEGEYEDEMRIAVKTLQEYGGIPVTGEVDAATLELMSKKRCGRPDVEPGYAQHRRKRFAVQGEKWKHTNLTWR
ncbi:putative peptidoglycan binding domain-containing protein [Phthorimaea operculella]|nr:putative peptidoglycan binding domain-containing protein [Phthorimaea operculella]